MPAKVLFGARDVRAALLGIVLRQRATLDRQAGLDAVAHQFRELQHGELDGIAQVMRFVAVVSCVVHQFYEAVNQVVYVAERARLAAVAVNRERLA